MITLNYDEAVALLKRAVEERGADYNYLDDPRAWDADEDRPMCQNVFYDGTPGCIIGQVMAWKGVDAETIDYFRYSPVASLVSVAGYSADGSEPGPVELDSERTYRLLAGAQAEQDSGTPWGEAVARAIENVDDLEYNA